MAQTDHLPEKKPDDEMKIALLVFNNLTLLDFVGFYDPITRLKTQGHLPKLHWDLCSYTDLVQDSLGLSIGPLKVRPSLDAYDLVFVPGGFGTRPLQTDQGFMNWLKTADKVPVKVSVCTGSLLLGAAGFLRDRQATTNFKEYATLAPYCARVLTERIVEDRQVITAGAVSSSLDLGLYICEKLAGSAAREAIRVAMDYPAREIAVKKI